MKINFVYIFIIIAVLVASCSSLKKSDSYNKEQIMKADALAIGYVECKTELTSLMLADSANDVQLKNELTQLNDDLTTIKQSFFKKYKQNEEDIQALNLMKQKSSKELSVCKKLAEYKALKEENKKTDKK